MSADSDMMGLGLARCVVVYRVLWLSSADGLLPEASFAYGAIWPGRSRCITYVQGTSGRCFAHQAGVQERPGRHPPTGHGLRTLAKTDLQAWCGKRYPVDVFGENSKVLERRSTAQLVYQVTVLHA